MFRPLGNSLLNFIFYFRGDYSNIVGPKHGAGVHGKLYDSYFTRISLIWISSSVIFLHRPMLDIQVSIDAFLPIPTHGIIPPEPNCTHGNTEECKHIPY